MASLVSRAEFATWVRRDIAEDDEYATLVLELASEQVREAARQPAWDAATVPFRARLIAMVVAGRAYTNPDRETATSVGPLSSRVVDEAAAGIMLTEVERTELETMKPAATGGRRGIWVQGVSLGDPEPERPITLFDSSGSDWGITYGDPNDPVTVAALTPETP